MRIQSLIRDIRSCRICVDAPVGKPLRHTPRPVLQAKASARICIAGQAPGTRVHQSGLPFTDPSGDRLRAWMGVNKATFYDAAQIAILPMGFCFPGLDKNGSDLPPRRECAAMWRDKLFAKLQNLELMLLVGRYAQDWHLGPASAPTVTDTVRNWHEILKRSQRPAFLPLPHPSWRNSGWLKRNPWFEAEVLPELRTRVADLIAQTGPEE
jgi:uracil-DNA glycosylase